MKKFYINLFNNRTSDVPTVAQIKAVVEIATKSHDNFMKYITFIDSFDKNHEVFRFYTRLHLALMNGPVKDKIYRNYFYKMLSLDHEVTAHYEHMLDIPTDGPVA